MKRRHILILDDERGGVQHLYQALNSYHDIVYCRNIRDATAELDKRHYDMVVCGVHLLHESMFDFLYDVRQTARTKGVPFLCFRAVETKLGQQLDAQLEAAARMLGADDYLIVESSMADAAMLRSKIEEHLKPK